MTILQTFIWILLAVVAGWFVAWLISRVMGLWDSYQFKKNPPTQLNMKAPNLDGSEPEGWKVPLNPASLK